MVGVSPPSTKALFAGDRSFPGPRRPTPFFGHGTPPVDGVYGVDDDLLFCDGDG